MIRDINNQIENELTPAQRRGILNINKLINMNQRQKLKNHILNYMELNKLNTYNCRKAEKGGIKPLGVSVNTVNKILKDKKYQPSRFALQKLLSKIGVEFSMDCGIICIHE